MWQRERARAQSQDIENMSYSIYPYCSTRTDVFSHGSGEQDIVNLGNLSGRHFSRGVIDGPFNPATLTG
jgi:hypothetical protein